MAALITKGMIGISLMLLISVTVMSLLVSFGNEYGVNLESQYQNRFGTTTEQNGGIGANRDSQNLIYTSSELQEGSDVDNTAQDTAQSPGSIAATRNQLSMQTIIQDFGNDLRVLGIDFYPSMLMFLISIFAIGLLSSFIYIFSKVIA